MEEASVIKIDRCIFSDDELQIGPFSLSVNKGDVCVVDACGDDYASLFLKGLATLSGIRGRFFFNGDEFPVNDYKKLLNVKKRVAYLGSSCALLSNRSILENIYLSQLWENDEDEIILDKNIKADCEEAGINEYLYMKPAGIPDEIKCGVYIVRELKKNPEIVLLERPYLFTMGRLDIVLRKKIGEIYSKGVPVVFSSSTGFIPENKITHTIKIEENSIEKIAR